MARLRKEKLCENQIRNIFGKVVLFYKLCSFIKLSQEKLR